MDETRYRDRIGQLVEPGERLLAHAKADPANGALPAPPPDAAGRRHPRAG